MEIIVSNEPYLVIDWTDSSEADKEKALAGINAAFAAIGATAAHGALASLSTVTSEQYEAADLWDSMEELALMALGKDVTVERLPGFEGRIEPWVSEERSRRCAGTSGIAA